MRTLRRAAAPAAALLVGCALSACGASDGARGANQTAAEEQGAAPQSQSLHPDPIASLQLANGHIVEVYDFASRALVMESAKAETGPVLHEYGDLIRSGHVADLFEKLRPDLPVPAALREAEARFVASAASAPVEERGPNVLPAGPTTEGGGGRGQPGKFEPLDCGNGCCNDYYLRNNLCSWELSQRIHWFYENYGYSNEIGTNFVHWEGTVCSAGGTSLYTVDINGSIWWPVQQGYWLNYWWTNCGNCGGTNGQAWVNDVNNQHLHTFCGSLY